MIADSDWVRLELRLDDFDPARHAASVESVVQRGIRLSILEALGDTGVHRRSLYELNARGAADIPDRGPFFTWEEYRRHRLEVPSFSPAGVVVALDGDDWVGMAASSDHHRHGYVFNEMTGVVRERRREGIALAMKVTGVAFGRDCGVPVARTVHHPRNEAIIRLNRSLGYVDATWPYPTDPDT